MNDRRLAVLACAAAALSADLGRLHARHRDDSLVFALASTQVWTPFFWEQDRVGLLVPLLASSIEHPWSNLLAQVWATATLGMLVPVLAGAYASPGPAGVRAGLAAAAALLWLGPPGVLDHTLFECYYPTGLTLGLAALLLLDRPAPGRWRRIVAAMLFALAGWVYLTAVPLGLGPLVVFRAWARAGWRRPLAVPADPHLRAVAGPAGVGVAVGVGLMIGLRPDSPDYQPADTRALPAGLWPDMAADLLGVLLAEHDPTAWLLTLLAGFAAGMATRAGRAAWPAAVPLLLAGLVEFAFVCTRMWPIWNEYHPRYYLAAVLFLGPALLLPLAERVRVPVAVLAAALVGGAVYRYGPPSPANARAALDAAVGRHTAELLASEADAVGGEYWGVWAAAFHVNLARYERGDRRPFPAVAFRACVWRPVWEREYPDGMTLAVFRGYAQIGQVRRVGRLSGLSDPRPVGRTPTFDLYRVTTRGVAGPQPAP